MMYGAYCSMRIFWNSLHMTYTRHLGTLILILVLYIFNYLKKDRIHLNKNLINMILHLKVASRFILASFWTKRRILGGGTIQTLQTELSARTTNFIKLQRHILSINQTERQRRHLYIYIATLFGHWLPFDAVMNHPESPSYLCITLSFSPLKYMPSPFIFL